MPYRWALSLIVEGVQTYERFCDLAPPANCGRRRAPRDRALRQPARDGETARSAFAFLALRLAQRKVCAAERHRCAQAVRCQTCTHTRYPRSWTRRVTR